MEEEKALIEEEKDPGNVAGGNNYPPMPSYLTPGPGERYPREEDEGVHD